MSAATISGIPAAAQYAQRGTKLLGVERRSDLLLGYAGEPVLNRAQLCAEVVVALEGRDQGTRGAGTAGTLDLRDVLARRGPMRGPITDAGTRAVQEQRGEPA